MKKYIIICTVILLLACNGTAWAVEPQDIETAAQELAALGLLQGDGQGLDLDSSCNRLHGAVLFTRLLGQEQEALANPRPHPFTDIGNDSWVAPYLGYLYNNGLAYGQASNHYGGGAMLPAHFATFCLRALGYTEGAAASDFVWNDALNVMVEKGIISGTLRNRLRYTPNFTRGDAVLLAYATLSAETKTGEGQTLFQQLMAKGVLPTQQPDVFSAEKPDFNIAYPVGLLANEVLDNLAVQQGLPIGRLTYEPNPQGEEELYRALREPNSNYDVCIVPGYVVERLRLDGLLRSFAIRDFGGREAFVAAVRDNPYWFDEENADYYALPLAFELPCLYFDTERVQNPDWSWLFREAYSGGVYMPAETSMLLPLALHYYGLPYDTAEDKKLSPAISLLSEQNSGVPAYLDKHMLDIAERENAIFGIIPSRLLPELEQRQQQNSAYASWQAILPPAGAPITLYYAVMLQSGDKQASAALLQGLLQPQTAGANGQFGGYLPAVSGAGEYLSGAVAAAYPGGRWERCRLLNLDTASRGFFEQGMRNALLLEAQNTVQPELAALEFSFEQQGQVYRAYRVDLVERTAAGFWAGVGQTEVDFNAAQPLPERLVKEFKKEANRLGLALWKDYYDGPADGASWRMTLTFADGSSTSSGGYGLPLLWDDLTGAMLKLCAEEALPNTL